MMDGKPKILVWDLVATAVFVVGICSIDFWHFPLSALLSFFLIAAPLTYYFQRVFPKGISLRWK